jgi:DNA (cytosine-5)-methyltransferase 1
MRHGSLFSGVGGFDLAAEWMGWENVFHCEWNEFGKRILKYYWPEAISYNDIRTTDFTIHRGSIDILTGGFPCQPYSTAGKRKGKEDDRHLWPEMLRAIREIQPCYVVGENVRGLTNWNGGMVFDEVQADLEVEGYEVTPFLLPACAVNAPHRRDRIWFVAYNHKRSGQEHKLSAGRDLFKEWPNPSRTVANTSNAGAEGLRSGRENAIYRSGFIAYSDSTGRETPIRQLAEQERTRQADAANARYRRTDWRKFPTQSPLCGGNDGLSRELDGITFSKWRNESLKGYGNAIVPQVAFEIFQAIDDIWHTS